MHAAVGRPLVSPYRPALQLLQAPAPVKLYCPTGQAAGVEEVDPATHTYPAVQFPLHDALGRPVVAPYVPDGHDVHTPAPAKLYWPATQTAADDDTLPAAQAYPALHSPLHAALLSPDIDP